jgi:Cytochrome C oxidase, cbb3-type, subunit III
MIQHITRPGLSPRWIRRVCGAFAAIVVLCTSACQQRMAQSPYYRPLEESEFFADGRSARPLEAGTISAGQPLVDNALITGLTPQGRRGKPKPKIDESDKISPEGILPGAANDVDNFVKEFPFKMEEADVVRGMDRYRIFCSHCHGAMGDGKGKIFERGYLQPTAYYPLRDNDGKVIEGTGVARGFQRFHVMKDGKPLLLQDVPVGYYFEVITRGFGGMPDHAAQVPPEDRWRIIAFIRTLQLSQSASLKGLPDEQKTEVEKALGGKQP